MQENGASQHFEKQSQEQSICEVMVFGAVKYVLNFAT